MKKNAKTRLPKLILASASPRRSDLLKKAGLKFEIHPAEVTERSPGKRPMSARLLVKHNAELKARAVASKFPDRWVLGADTVVVLGRKIYGKPSDMDEAVRMLQKLCGRTHRVLTGVCLLKGREHRRASIVSTKVTFKKLSDSQIHEYLKLIHPLDKAGSYAAQEYRGKIIKGVEGSFTNVVGLPMEYIMSELQKIKATF
jgi:septum formation protein